MKVSYADDLVAEGSYTDKNGQVVKLQLTMGDLKAGFSPIKMYTKREFDILEHDSSASTVCVTTVECKPSKECGRCQRCVATTKCVTTIKTPLTVHSGSKRGSVYIETNGYNNEKYGVCQGKISSVTYKQLLDQWILQEFDNYGYTNVRIYKTALNAIGKIISSFVKALMGRLKSDISSKHMNPSDLDIESMTGGILGIHPVSVSSSVAVLPFEDSKYTTPLSRQMITMVVRDNFMKLIQLQHSNVPDICVQDLGASAAKNVGVNIITPVAVKEAGRQFQQRTNASA